MKAQFLDLHAAADFMGPGAIEVNRYQTEITDIVRRRGIFGQRIKQVPATGHPSRFFEQTAIPSPGAANAFVDPRNIVAADGDADARGAQRSAEGAGRRRSTTTCSTWSGRSSRAVRVPAGEGPGRHRRRRDAHARCRAVERQRHLAEHADHGAVLRRGRADRRRRQHGDDRRQRRASSTDSSRRSRRWWRTASYEVRPTAIYANPVLLDLIDREMKTRVQRGAQHRRRSPAALRVKTLSTQAGDLPLIPEWTLGYTGTPGSGTAVLPAYIVTRRPDRVPLAERSESARLPAGTARIAGLAVCRGEVRRRGGEGRELRALQSQRNAVTQCTVSSG